MFQMKILKSKEGKILSLIFIAFDCSMLLFELHLLGAMQEVLMLEKSFMISIMEFVCKNWKALLLLARGIFSSIVTKLLLTAIL